MTAENFDRILESLMSRRPFRLFTVELNGGSQFEVDAPRSVVFHEGIAVFIAPGGIPVWFDHNSVNKIIEASADTAV